jgi:hypothetical protein
MNRHNSRQGCNSDKLVTQSEPTCDIALAQGMRGHEKTCYHCDGAFGARHSHVRVKRCYGSKIRNGGFIKVTSGLMGPMRKGDTIRCLSNGRKGREDLPYDSKEFKAASGLYPHNL